MPVCLLITRERVYLLPPNFQGSSREPQARFKVQKYWGSCVENQKNGVFCGRAQQYPSTSLTHAVRNKAPTDLFYVGSRQMYIGVRFAVGFECLFRLTMWFLVMPFCLHRQKTQIITHKAQLSLTNHPTHRHANIMIFLTQSTAFHAALWWMIAIYWLDFSTVTNPSPMSRCQSPRAIGFIFGTGKLKWLSYNMVKSWLCHSGTIHQRDRHTDSHIVIANAAPMHCRVAKSNNNGQ